MSERKMLFIAFAFPPAMTSGTIRLIKLVKYLPEFGWKPIVVAPHDLDPVNRAKPEDYDFSDTTIIRARYKDLRRVLRRASGYSGDRPIMEDELRKGGAPSGGYRLKNRVGTWALNNFILPDVHIGWYPAAVRAGIEAARKYDCEVIFSSSPPETPHLAAARIKKTIGKPWIADFRDFWSENMSRYERTKPIPHVRMLERFVMRHADTFTTISETYAARLNQNYPALPAPACAIYNGFDIEDYPAERVPPTEKFTFTFTGGMDGKQVNPEMFFEALAAVIAEGAISRDRVAVRFFGHPAPFLAPLAARHGLESVVRHAGMVSHTESVRAQRESTVLLFIDWINAEFYQAGSVPAKIFEYLGARRPILAMAHPDGEGARIIRDTGAGRVEHESEPLRAALREYFAEYRATGTVAYRGAESDVLKYNRRESAGKLAAIADRIAGAKPRAVKA